MNSGRIYHCAVGQQTYGPYPEATLREWFEQGRMSRETPVWTEGMSDWVPASQLPAFAPAPARPVPAPSAQPAQPDMALAPSELLFFHAERFCKEGGMMSGGNFQLLHTGAKVGYQELSADALLVALLAMEERGEVRLRLEQEKGFFRTTPVALVEFLDELQYWPPGSLEFQLIGMLTGQPVVKVRDLVYTYIGRDLSHPYSEVVLRLQAGLAGRGYLSLVERSGLGKLFSLPTFSLEPQTMGIVAREGAERVSRLLEGCRQGRPELYKALGDGLRSGITSRLKSSD